MENKAEKTKKDFPTIRYGLAPQKKDPSEFQSDMPNGLETIWPLANLPDGKPAKETPSFWRWKDYLDWLKSEKTDSFRKEHNLDKVFGLKLLTKETRIHVSIDSDTGTAKDGALFSTESLRFERKDEDGKLRFFAIGCSCSDERLESKGKSNASVVLGGKGRISTIKNVELAGGVEDIPDQIPDKLLNSLGARIRVILLTPALFGNGFMPDGRGPIDPQKVVAGRCERGQFISGWDMETRSPKKARRMVPAGSVYWLDFSTSEKKQEKPSEQELEEARKRAQEWAKEHWFKCISDDEQDRKDGFGLCVIGRE
jgi:CRISPR-associated protein Cmr3